MTLESSGAPAIAAPRRARKADKADIDPKEALERMLLNAHRLAVSLSDLGVFRQSEITVAEWVILKTLDNRKDVPTNQISASTGVSRQRLGKVIAELEQKGLVLTGRSTAEDKRVRMISATPTAEQVLSLISRQLQELVPEASGNPRGRQLAVAVRSMELVARTIRRTWQRQRPSRDQSERRGDNAAKRGAPRASA